METYAVRIESLCTLASGSRDNWQETFSVLAKEGVSINTKTYADYTGPTIPCDQLLYYATSPEECPVNGPEWLL